MKTFYCEEIACEGCAARIDRALDAAGIRLSVDLENKTVTVEETAGVAPEILFDLGFTPVER